MATPAVEWQYIEVPEFTQFSNPAHSTVQPPPDRLPLPLIAVQQLMHTFLAVKSQVNQNFSSPTSTTFASTLLNATTSTMKPTRVAGLLNQTQASSAVLLDDDSAGMSNWEFWWTVLIVLFGTVLGVLTTGGNLLVMISMKIDKQLQTISNYFLFSLAVADVTIGFVSIPLMTYYTAKGEWKLGYVLCQFWLCVDYLMCNASVLNLLLISFDRYFSITRPLTYRPRRTTRKAMTMIMVTYVISIILWPPWIVSWPYIEGRFAVQDNECMVQFIKTNAIATIGTALAAFYLPVGIMVYLYAKVYMVTKNRQKELAQFDHATGASTRTPKRDPSTVGADETSSSRRPSAQALISEQRSHASGSYKSVSRNSSRAHKCSTAVPNSVANHHPAAATVHSYADRWRVRLSGFRRHLRLHRSPPGPPLSDPEQVDQSTCTRGENDWVEGATTQTQPCSIRLYDTPGKPSDETSLMNGGTLIGWLAVRRYHSARLHQRRRNSADTTSSAPHPANTTSTAQQPTTAIVKRGSSRAANDVEDTVKQSYTVLIQLEGCSTPISRQYRTGSHDVAKQPTIHRQRSQSHDANTLTADRSRLGQLQTIGSGQTVPVHAKPGRLLSSLKGTKSPAGPKVSNDASSVSKRLTSSINRSSHSGGGGGGGGSIAMTSLRATPGGGGANNSRTLSTKKKEGGGHASKSESKAAKTLSAILAAFILTWTPYNILVCIYALGWNPPDWMWSSSYLLCYINSTINPFCYAFANAQFRHTYLRVLKCRWKKERGPAIYRIKR